jgi:hypothetical protein
MNVTNSKGQQEFSFGKEIHFGARGGGSPQEEEDNGGRFFARNLLLLKLGGSHLQVTRPQSVGLPSSNSSLIM